MTDLFVTPARLERWVANFTASHGATALSVTAGRLTGTAADGSSFLAALPFDLVYAGAADPASFAEASTAPEDWAVLLVRKGGFAVARLHGTELVAHKIGQRHVQGRTKAGGQSQQRFARRRVNQARVAYEAAAGHAHRLVAGAALVVTGGDRAAVAAVLGDPRLHPLSQRVVGTFLAVPDPGRRALDAAVIDAGSVRMSVTNA